MASNKDPKQPEEEDDLAAERDLGDDAMWKQIQKNTFTRYVGLFQEDIQKHTFIE